MSHTPGPWFENLQRRPKGQPIEIINGNPTASALAYVPHHGKFSEANAKLIAAAPDLVQAVKNFVGFAEYHELEKANPRFRIQLLEMRAALAKAGL